MPTKQTGSSFDFALFTSWIGFGSKLFMLFKGTNALLSIKRDVSFSVHFYHMT